MIPDEIVEQVREAADIVGIIGEYVPLKRTGADFRGPCPFHQGTRRNFSVSPARHMYHCFVCAESGDVFKFLTKRLGVDWPHAVRMVAERVGIEVPDTQRRREGPDPREPFWELHATAAAYFQQMLWDENIGAPAREYLEQREISRAVAEEFGLGFAPREIGLMRSYMNTLGFDDARLVEGGLLGQADQEAEPRPRFRNRLIFPIVDAGGRHVGFGGRLIGPGDAKYINSPESPVFSKGRLLYGLHRARNAMRKADRVLLVEGYFDALRVSAAGVAEVVAPLGTAVTEAQAVLLSRQTRNAYILFDSDPPGLRATFRAGDELLRQGVSVRVVTLPSGEDPDSFVRAQGASGLETQIAVALDVFERKVQILQRAGWFGELQKRRRALDRLLPTIRATADPLMRDLYIGRASEVSGVDRQILLSEAARTREAAPAPQRSAAPAANRVDVRARGGDRRHRSRVRAASAERELVRAMLQQPALVEGIAENIGPEEFREPAYREIFARLLQAGGNASLEQIAASLEPEDVEIAQGLLEDTGAIMDVDRTVADSLAKLQVRGMEDRVTEIDRLLPLATGAERDTLEKERRLLVLEMRASGKMTMKAFRRGPVRDTGRHDAH